MMKHGYFLVIDINGKRAYVLAFDSGDNLAVMLPREGHSVYWYPSRKTAEAAAKAHNAYFRKDAQD